MKYIILLFALSALFAVFFIKYRDWRKFIAWRLEVLHQLGSYREQMLSDDLAESYWLTKTDPVTAANEIINGASVSRSIATKFGMEQ